MRIKIEGMFSIIVDATEKEILDLTEILTFNHRIGHKDPFVLFDKEENRFLRGLTDFVVGKMKYYMNSVEVISDDKKKSQLSVKSLRGISYRDYQIESIEAAIAAKSGIIKVATAGGKTVIAAGLIKSVNKQSLFLITQIPLMYQVIKKFNDFGIPDVGIIGDGKITLGKTVVAFAPYLSQIITGRNKNQKMVLDWLYGVKVVICDEGQHAFAKSWTVPILNCSNSEYRIALSGTPFEGGESGMTVRDAQLIGLTGPVLYEISASSLIEEGYIARPKIFMFRINGDRVDIPPPKKGCKPYVFQRTYNKIYDAGIVNHENRNNTILEVVLLLSKVYKLKTLVLVSRIEHGKSLLKRISRFVPSLFVAGQKQIYKCDEQGEIINETDEIVGFESMAIKSFISGDFKVLLASPVLGEGYDLPGLAVDAMVLVPGGKGVIPVLQRLGRALRPKPGGGEVIIIDFDDHQHVFLRSQSNSRMESYALEGHQLFESDKLFGYLEGEELNVNHST